MSQNPMSASRIQVGGRQMPSWFPTPMGNATRTTMATPPPLPEEPPPIMDESEYEEIDHLPSQNGVRRGRGRRVCNLCGDSNAVVCCEMCEGQIFCGGCNDVYHRHPKRLHHARKLIDAGDSRPPLPPKAFATHNSTPQQADGPPVLSSLPPVPPPRRNKRFPFIGMGMRSATSSPTLTKKTFDPMATLKRFVGGMAQRPLPPTPKSGPPLPPKPTEFGRPVTPVMTRGQSISDFDRRHSSPAPQMSPTGRRPIPQTMHEFQAPRNHPQSVSVANLSMQRPPSRNNGGYPEWEEEDYFARQRASSVSIPNRFPNSSQDASHFATLQRPRRGQNNSMAAPERPPPPLPPRSYPSQSQLGFQTSQSAFNINQMGIPQNQQFGNMHPWNYPPASGGSSGYPMEFQQAAMMGYTGSMRRTPSNQSMGGVPQQFFGWGPMGFGPPMSQQEMEMEIMARRGSESMWMQQGQQQQPPLPPRPPSVTQSQPVTPQGSFRRKTRPSIQHEEQREQQFRNIHQPPPPHERFVQNQQFTQRPPTPKSGLSRMNPSPIQFQETTIRDLEEEAALEYAGSDTPDGPWTCEHCTFVNPKSTKICTICCKTPAHGYKSKPSKYAGGKPETHQRKGSSSSTNENEDIPVIQSKLSISRRGEQQQATINLIESIERVKTPTKDRKKLSSRPGFASAVSTNNNNEEEEDDDDQELLNQTAQHHQIKINTKKPKPVPIKSKMNDSNEDVYGSVPVQATTISPKIDIRRHPKMVSTGVSSSPPKPHHEQTTHQQLRKPVALKNKPPPETLPKPISKDENSSSQLNKNKNKNKNNRNDSSSSSSSNPEQTRSSPSSSSSSTSDSIKKPILPNPSTNVSSTSKQTLLSVSSTGVQADGPADNRGESGSESNRSGSGTSSSGQIATSSSVNIDKRGENTVSNTKKLERKSSKGTSPPPQSISTQTYEELPASTMHQNSMSKTSMQSLQSDDFAPPKPIEMSEKALRYVRKARHHHEAKLKRSLSTHLYSASGDPWMDAMDSHGKSMYRSSSRHSLMDDTRSLPLSGPSSRDTSPPPRNGRFFEDFRQFQPPPSWDRFPAPEGYFASLEDIVSRRRKDSMRSQDFELNRLLKEAEDYNYTTEDVQVALKMCGDRNPVKWLQENWSSMVETVQTLATKYGREKGENNQTGTISSTEAKNALRANRRNVWAAVTECIEQRRKKFLELQSRGTFLPEDILTALTANHGNLDAAYIELSKAQLKPFLMRMWASPSDGLDNNLTASNSLKGAESKGPNISGGGDIIPSSPNQTASGHAVARVNEAITQNSKTVQEVPALNELEPEPRLELLVSNAAKVSQEIEKAILELKQSKQSKTLESASDEKNNQNPEQVSLIKEEPVEFHPKGQITIVKSDEEESFVDAVSTSDYEIHAISPRQDSSDNIDMSNEDLADEDEDVLEIEIDDTEANISEFIQNYEIVNENSINVQTNNEPSETIPAPILNNESMENLEIGHENNNLEANPSSEPTVENQADQLAKVEEIVPESAPVQDLENKINDAPATGSQIIGPHMSPTDIEQLLSTLTTTFTEMGQFATDINFRYQIASQIHQQLAVAVNAITTQNETKIPTADPNLDFDERVYEPVTLSESVSQGVDKKLAKYKRLAAKRERKSNRHKSPDARSSRAKDTSRSSSPGSSLSERVAISVSEDIVPDEAVVGEDKGVGNVSDGSSPFPNAQVEIVGTDNDLDDSLRLVQDEDDLPRDEGEYNSSPDDESEISDEEFDESENEKNSSGSKSGSQQVEVDEDDDEEEDDEGDELNGDEVPSSADDSELEQLAEGEYEEIDVNHSSDFEIYNNKDTEKILTDEAIDNSKPFVPSGMEKLEKASSPVVDVETKPNVTKTEKEMKMEKLMTDGKVETGEKAELAVQLIDMNFTDEDSIYAANECSSLYSALSFLQQECDLCTGKFSARQMVSMLRCTHVCCHTCAKEYFTVQVRDKTIVDATCPFCSEPTHLTDDTEAATDYFNHLDILLKSILEPRYHEMFQRKLRDWALAKTPNFKWCSKCSSGFITEPLQTRLICPDCNAVTCAICLEQWDKFNHDHRESKVKVCDSSSKTIVDYLNENNIECPRCHFRFALARGGCMHLTCTQCRHEFCSGCSASFRMGDKCDAKLPICERLGLHAHHPRNCLFYLRDKEPEILCKLLEENAIPYLKENSGSPNDDRPTKRTCQVPIQKETNEGLRDDICGKDAPVGYATVCNGHYVEYLGLLIWQNQLDPTSILSCDDLEVIIRRSNKKHPGRPFATTDEEFRNRLLKVIQDEIPL